MANSDGRKSGNTTSKKSSYNASKEKFQADLESSMKTSFKFAQKLIEEDNFEMDFLALKTQVL